MGWIIVVVLIFIVSCLYESYSESKNKKNDYKASKDDQYKIKNTIEYKIKPSFTPEKIMKDVSDYVNVLSEVQKATAALRSSIYIERTLIEQAMSTAEIELKIIKSFETHGPSFKEDYEAAYSKWTKILREPELEAPTAALEDFAPPNFKNIAVHTNPKIAEAVERKVSVLRNERDAFIKMVAGRLKLNAKLAELFKSTIEKRRGGTIWRNSFKPRITFGDVLGNIPRPSTTPTLSDKETIEFIEELIREQEGVGFIRLADGPGKSEIPLSPSSPSSPLSLEELEELEGHCGFEKHSKLSLDEYNFSKCGVTSLWHMTDVENIDSIAKNGFFNHDDAFRLKPDRVDISNPGVQKIRERREPCYGRKIHSYVPMYINPRNPMLYFHLEKQSNICLIQVSLSAISKHEYLITDGNAASRDTRFFNSTECLDSLPWDVLDAEYWSDFQDGKRKRCAEVLIYPRVAAKHIIAIHCHSIETMNKISKCHHKVILSKHLYF